MHRKIANKRNLENPHIVKTNGEYVCSGQRVIGAGSTAEGAYLQWQKGTQKRSQMDIGHRADSAPGAKRYKPSALMRANMERLANTPKPIGVTGNTQYDAMGRFK